MASSHPRWLGTCRALAVVGALVLWILAAPAGGEAGRPVLEYEVRLDDLRSRSLYVQLNLRNWPTGPLRLHGVPAYLDNPTPRGNVVRRLRIHDSTGERLAVRQRRGHNFEPVFEVLLRQGTATITYELVDRFATSPQTKRYPIQIPFMNDERAWLYGNCLFVVPELAGSPAHAARVPLDIRVRFVGPDSVPLVGPPAEFRLPNLYALHSLQFGLGAFHAEQARAAGLAFALVYRDTVEFDAAERRRLRACTARIVEIVTRFFGTPAYPSVAFYYYRRDGTGGLEGSYALQAYTRPQVDLTDTTNAAVRAFLRVALHEFFHTWNPVAIGMLDDPWVKEGLTSYYDMLLSSRLGWSTAKDRRGRLDGYKRRLRKRGRFTAQTLTDPRIWQHEYDSEDWRTLTYDRGLAVSLLLDLWIRERSENARSLDDVVQLIHKRFLHGAASHETLLETIRDATGVDARPFFDTHIDGRTLASAIEIEAALVRAESLGVFSPPGAD